MRVANRDASGSGGFCSYSDAQLRDQLSGWVQEGIPRVKMKVGRGFKALLGNVDVLQADVTRCGGITGFLQADALCFAQSTTLSAHCAPSLAVHPMAVSQQGHHIEWFHDHARIESLLFDDALPSGRHLATRPATDDAQAPRCRALSDRRLRGTARTVRPRRSR